MNPPCRIGSLHVLQRYTRPHEHTRHPRTPTTSPDVAGPTGISASKNSLGSLPTRAPRGAESGRTSALADDSLVTICDTERVLDSRGSPDEDTAPLACAAEPGAQSRPSGPFGIGATAAIGFTLSTDAALEAGAGAPDCPPESRAAAFMSSCTPSSNAPRNCGRQCTQCVTLHDAMQRAPLYLLRIVLLIAVKLRPKTPHSVLQRLGRHRPAPRAKHFSQHLPPRER